MQKLITVFLLFPLFCSAQFKGRKIDIEHFNAKPIDISLVPNYDFFNFKYDIVRETKTVEINDSTDNKVELDYNELGFDLGNFLFYDLNGNLSFRIDQMLNINPFNDFTIVVEDYPFRKRNRFYYKYNDGTFSSKQKERHPYKEIFNIDVTEKTVDKYYKNRYRFSILQDKKGLFKKYKNRNREAIYYRDVDYFNTSKKEKWGDKFFIDEETVCLNWNVFINSNDEYNGVEIRYTKRQKHPVYTIQMNESEIIIYNHKKRGYYIHYNNNEVEIYDRKRMIKRYRLITI